MLSKETFPFHIIKLLQSECGIEFLSLSSTALRALQSISFRLLYKSSHTFSSFRSSKVAIRLSPLSPTYSHIFEKGTVCIVCTLRM
jgi:hypothetical protein